MPPFGHERYEMGRQLSEAKKLELSVAQRMRRIMDRNRLTEAESIVLTPKVEYEPSSEVQGEMINTWLQVTYPLGRADEGEIMLLTQKVSSQEQADKTLAVPRLKTHRSKDVPVEYEGREKDKMSDDERQRMARDVMATLDLIEKAVYGQPMSAYVLGYSKR